MKSTHTAPAAPVPHPTQPFANGRATNGGYAGARLRLGIFGVGFWVVASAGLLALSVSDGVRGFLPGGIFGDLALIGLLFGAYVVIQFPMDVIGGYWLPKRYGRKVASAPGFVATLLRGIGVHTATLLCSVLVLYAGGKLGGIVGAFAAGLGSIGLLAAGRGVIAGLVARMGMVDRDNAAQKFTDLRTGLIEVVDEGFTGGVTGLVTPGKNLLPAAWIDLMSSSQFAVVEARRAMVIRSGAWRAGRLAAMAYIACGLLVALVLAGPASAGTGVGVVETGLWFTLWSFVGLLVLPSLSRRAVYRIDHLTMALDSDPQASHQVRSVLDTLQDDEPARSRWIERIFHPIPSVTNRWHGDAEPAIALWDVARTSVYLGIAGASLLTRSVHCNVGRPSLWVWLPTE